MKLSRNTLIVVPAAALGLLIGSPIAAADPGTIGGCSAGFTSMTVDDVVDTIAAPSFEPSIRAKDANTDGLLCIKLIPNGGGPKQFDPAFVYADNFTGR